MLGSWRSCERVTRFFSLEDLLCPTNPSPCHPIPRLPTGEKLWSRSFKISTNKIEQAPQTPGFYSRLFVVQKDSGAWRPIIDLSTLNTYIASQHFHMETPQSVLRSIRQGDWMISLDLQDAYLQVPVHPESRRYLRFTMGGVPYQFRVLCFGLTTAPQIFTRLMAPISAILHRYGIRMLRYLDDWLILAESRTTCLQARDRLLQLCEELGLQVNLRKSSLVPSQDMTYLGMQILSVRFVAKPTETRVVNLLNIIEEFLSTPDPPAALWRRLLGHLSSLTLLVKGGMLRMRSLQIRVRSKWNFRDNSLCISWDPLCQEDLLWWSWAIQQREGVDLSLPVPDLSFYSDASDVGWGAIVGEHQVSGVWTPSQREVSINLREMMAVQNGLLQFSSLLRGKTIALFCDNVSTVAYLRRSGGTRSQVLFLKAREILLWVESMKITLLPQFIQGSLNTRADLLSWPNLVIGSEWTLHQEVVQGLLHQWPAIIDLFTTSLTARLPVFFTPAWEPRAAGVLRQLKSSRSSSEHFEVVQEGFLPPTAGRSLIGGTSACSAPLLQVTAPSLAFGLATADGSRTGMGGHLSSPPSGVAGCGNSCALEALCIDRNFFPVNPGLF